MRRSSVISIGLVTAIVPLLMMTSYNAATAYLFFTPHKGDKVSVKDPLTVNGTSAPSNSTRAKCTVQFRTDGTDYAPVIPMGKGTANYTIWKTNGAVTVHPGVNVLEGKFTCFSPNILVFPSPSVPNFIHHLTKNITGV